MIVLILSAVLTCCVVGLLIHPSVRNYKRQSFILLLAFPVLFLGIYFFLGQPDLASTFAKYEKTSVRTDLRKLIHNESTLKIEAMRDPQNPKRWLKLGSVQIVLDKSSEAVESLQKAFDLSPKDQTIRTAFGAALLAQGIEAAQTEDMAKAHKIFAQGLKIAPKKAPYYEGLKEGFEKTRPEINHDKNQ